MPANLDGNFLAPDLTKRRYCQEPGKTPYGARGEDSTVRIHKRPCGNLVGSRRQRHAPVDDCTREKSKRSTSRAFATRFRRIPALR
jgi:hypothetical protein